MNPYSLLLALSGLSQREAADFHSVRPDTVKSWSAGRNRAPDGARSELIDLIKMQARAADAALSQYRKLVAEYGRPASVDLQYPDGEWPCDSAARMVLARVIAGLPADQPVTLPG